MTCHIVYDNESTKFVTSSRKYIEMWWSNKVAVLQSMH